MGVTRTFNAGANEVNADARIMYSLAISICLTVSAYVPQIFWMFHVLNCLFVIIILKNASH